MKFFFRPLCLLGFLSSLGGGSPLSAASATAAPSRFGIGVNYGGAQLDWRSSQKWMFEIRAQQGSDKNDNFETRSSLAGVRVYRFLHDGKSPTPFIGAETAAIRATQKGTTYEASGFSAGPFGGLSLRLSRHFVLELDAGPYFLELREKQTKSDKTEVDFVGDATLLFFI